MAATEAAVNSYDVEAVTAVYAVEALVQMVAGETEERFEGADAIRSAWRGYLDEMRSTGLQIRKTLVSAERDVLVNNNESTFRDGRFGGGIETWRFDADGKVIEHHMYSYFAPRPPSGLVERLRIYLRMALAMLKSRRAP